MRHNLSRIAATLLCSVTLVVPALAAGWPTARCRRRQAQDPADPGGVLRTHGLRGPGAGPHRCRREGRPGGEAGQGRNPELHPGPAAHAGPGRGQGHQDHQQRHPLPARDERRAGQGAPDEHPVRQGQGTAEGDDRPRGQDPDLHDPAGGQDDPGRRQSRAGHDRPDRADRLLLPAGAGVPAHRHDHALEIPLRATSSP